MFKRGRQLGPSSRSRSASPMSRSRSPFTPSYSSRPYYRSRAKGVNSISVFQGQSQTPEVKSVETNAAVFTAAAAVGTVTLLNGCAQGVTVNNHVGRKTFTVFVFGRCCLAVSPANATGVMARVLIVYDKETNNAAPIATDILFQDTIDSPMNLNNSDRFIILRDSGVMTATNGGASNGATPTLESAQFVYEYKRKVGLPVLYSGVGGTVASIETGGIFMLTYITSLGAAAPTIVGQSSFQRVRYTDS